MTLRGLVVVSGAPGSGKSTLALAVAPRLGAQLLGKDVIKEALWDALGDDAPANVGAAALHVLFALAAHSSLAVLDSFFWPGLSERDLVALDKPMVQVHCACPRAVSERRYRERARNGAPRDPRHDPDGVAASVARWHATPTRLDLAVPTRDVDTTATVDVAALVDWIEATLA